MELLGGLGVLAISWLFGLAVLLGGGWVVYKVIGLWLGSGVTAYKEAYDKEIMRGQAAAAARGEKPIGQPVGHLHGGAYFLSPDQVEAAGLGVRHDEFWSKARAGAPWLLLGDYTRYYPKKPPNSVVVVMQEAGHLLTVAPTRSGKGVSAAVPNLLFYGGSVVVNDIKGELHAVTARRRRELGQKVYAFAPFAAESASLNPLDLIDRSQAFEDVRLLALLVIPESAGEAAFWDNLARSLLAAVVLTVLESENPENRTMAHVRHMLTMPRADFEGLLQVISQGGEKLAARAANSFLGADEKVRAGIMSTLESHLQIWDSPRLEAVTSTSDFTPAELKAGGVSVFFILPPEQLGSFAPVVRLFMGLLVQGMTKAVQQPPLPVLFLIDEFPALGRVAPIEKGIAYLAGYGVRLWFFAQDLKQLATVYGEASANSLLSNCAVKQFFGVADNATADYISKAAGDTTSPTITYNQQSGQWGIDGGGHSLGTTGRPLLAPNELMTLDKKQQVIIAAGKMPIKCFKVNYLEMAESIKNESGGFYFDENPFYT